MEEFELISVGHFIQKTYLKPGGITAADLTRALKMTKGTVSRLLNDKSSLSPEVALKLSIVLGQSPETWMLLQARWSLSKAKKNVDFKKYTRLMPKN